MATGSGKRRFLETVSTCQRVNLDTNILIYHLRGEPRYAGLVTPLFQRAVEGSLEIRMSAIAFMEALVGPIRGNDIDLLDRLMNMARAHPNLWVEEVSQPIVFQAARIRAHSLDVARGGLDVPDCLVVATGIVTECDATITNDGRWQRFLSNLPRRHLLVRGDVELELPRHLYLDRFVDS